MTEIPQDSSSELDLKSVRPTVWHRYLGVLLSISAVLYLPPLALVRMANYEQWCSTPDSPILDYSFHTAGENADIVIFGDSSAHHGLNPNLVTQSTGLKTVNLPGSLSELIIDDDMPLRYYLAHNRPPRLIVLYFTAWNFDYGHDDLSIDPTYDGMELLLRNGSSDQITRFAVRHPGYALQFPLMFYRANLNSLLFRRKVLRDETEEVFATHGHVDSIGLLHAASNCVIPDRLIKRIHSGTVEQLLGRYQSSQTKVLVYIAPIPGCANARAVINTTHRSISFAPPRALPPNLFLDDAYYAHIFAEGVPLATQDLVDAIRAELVEPSTGLGRPRQ